MAAETIQQLLSYVLPKNQLVELHTRWPGASGYPLLNRHRQVDSNFVGGQYLELICAGGEAWETLGLAWNGRQRILGFDLDYGVNPLPGARGCNHPDNDGGAAEYALRTIVWEATGGDMAATTNRCGRGRWYVTVLPEGVDPYAFAAYVLEEMAKQGFAIGPGCLEVPMGIARLPLAGYILVDHAHRSWIEQVGELVNWIRHQSQLVRLRVALPSRDSPTALQTEGSLEPHHRKGVDLGGLRFLLDEGKRSNAFVLAAALRFARHGHDLTSVPLLVKQIEAHRDWIVHASANSKRDLKRGWARRAMEWALRTTGRHQPEKSAPSNHQRHQEWNRKVAEGIPQAMADGCEGITAVIAWLTEHMGMSKRLLWERVDLIKPGVLRALAHVDGGVQAEDACPTPTQSKPVGVLAGCLLEKASKAPKEGGATADGTVSPTPKTRTNENEQSDHADQARCPDSGRRFGPCAAQAAQQPTRKAGLTGANRHANRVRTNHAPVGPPTG